MVHISLEFTNWLLTEKHTDREGGIKHKHIHKVEVKTP